MTDSLVTIFVPGDSAATSVGADAVASAIEEEACGLGHAMRSGVVAPTLAQWQGLSVLERFAFVKLARSQHENENFAPALKEFGVLT